MAFNNEDILTLAKAGFNAQQIAALNMVGTTPAPVAPAAPAPVAPAPAPAAPAAPAPAAPAPVAPAPAPAAPAAPAPAAPAPVAPAPAPVAQGATVDDVLKSVKDLTATFQNGFMLNSQQPKPVTAEDILANIINPPQPEKEV